MARKDDPDSELREGEAGPRQSSHLLPPDMAKGTYDQVDVEEVITTMKTQRCNLCGRRDHIDTCDIWVTSAKTAGTAVQKAMVAVKKKKERMSKKKEADKKEVEQLNGIIMWMDKRKHQHDELMSK